MNLIGKYFKNLPEKEASKFLIIFYTVGLVGFLVPQTRALFEMLIPLSVLINVFMVLLFHRPFNAKHIIVFVLVVVATIAVEAIGTNTGLLFGEYYYGNALGIKLFHTPLLIGANWLVLIYGVVSIVRQVEILRRFSIISSGIIMVFFDWIMEPVAMKTDMWNWAFNFVPFQNYLMWFVISALIVAVFELYKVEVTKPIAGRLFVIQLVFFAVLNIFL